MNEALPPVLLAQIVYDANEAFTSGLPRIEPLVVSKVSPLGRPGEMAHEVAAPPLKVASKGNSGLVPSRKSVRLPDG